METSKVFVWKDVDADPREPWQVGIAVPLVNGEQMIVVKHKTASWRWAMDWIEENYVMEDK